MSGAQTVNFQSIPPNLRVPLFWVETSNAQAGANTQQQRVLVIGGTLNAMPLTPVWAPPPAGTGAAGAAQAVAAQAGAGSMLASMVGNFRLNDSFDELWYLPVPDPSGGTAATATIGVASLSSVSDHVPAAGVLSIYIAGILVAVPVAANQTVQSLPTAIVAAINAMTTLPVTASYTAPGTYAPSVVLNITLTSKHKGVSQNGLSLLLNYQGAPSGEITPSNMVVALSAFSGGAGTPVLTSVAAALGAMPFDFIISGFADSTSLAALTALTNDSAGRWSWVEQLFGGTFAADVDTAANLLTLGASLNDQHQCMIGATGTPTPSWQVAAAVMGACVPRIIAQPNIPLDHLTVLGVLAPPTSAGVNYSASTLQTLLTSGIAPLVWDRAGTCRVVRLITTYQTNSFGVPDQSYLDVGILYAVMSVLRTLKANATQRLSQKLIVDDGTPIGAGQPAISPSVERMNIYHDYLRLQSQLLVEDPTDFLAGLVVTRNANDPGRLDVLFDPHIVSGLHIYAVLNQFVLRAAQPSAGAVA